MKLSSSKLTAEQLAAVQMAYDAGEMSVSALARVAGCSRKAVVAMLVRAGVRTPAVKEEKDPEEAAPYLVPGMLSGRVAQSLPSGKVYEITPAIEALAAATRYDVQAQAGRHEMANGYRAQAAEKIALADAQPLGPDGTEGRTAYNLRRQAAALERDARRVEGTGTLEDMDQHERNDYKFCGRVPVWYRGERPADAPEEAPADETLEEMSARLIAAAGAGPG